ncbi:MAG: hypothetical protein HC846_07395 [Blastocatellia bacterium]|nr:hypothetical protein [Blastocatellia bacterium]
MADGYINKLSQFSGFPTTFFLDKNGKISFVVVGASSDLFEHFSWRIEALKGEN